MHYERLKRQLGEQQLRNRQAMNENARRRFESLRPSIERPQSDSTLDGADMARQCRGLALNSLPADVRDAESTKIITDICNTLTSMGADNSGNAAPQNGLLHSQLTDPNQLSDGANSAMMALDKADALNLAKLKAETSGQGRPSLDLPPLSSANCDPEGTLKLREAKARLARYHLALREIDSARTDVRSLSTAGFDAKLGGYLTGAAQVASGVADAAVDFYDFITSPLGDESKGLLNKPSLKTLYGGAKAGGAMLNSFLAPGPQVGAGLASGLDAFNRMMPEGTSSTGAAGKMVGTVDKVLKGKTAEAMEGSVEAVAETAKYAGVDKKTVAKIEAVGKAIKGANGLAKDDLFEVAEGFAGTAGKLVEEEAFGKAFALTESMVKSGKTAFQGLKAIDGASGEEAQLNRINESTLASIDRKRTEIANKIQQTTDEISRMSNCPSISLP